MNKANQFGQTITVQETDCDLNGRLLPSALLRFGQLIGEAHCASLGLDEAAYRRTHSAFLLARVQLEIKGHIGIGDTLEVLTTAGKMERAIFPRYTRFSSGGEVLATLDAAWILVEPESRSIYRHCPPGFPMAFEESLPSLSSSLPKVKEPQPLCRWVVPFSRCDKNGHLNNCHYADWVCDALPLDLMREKALRSLFISYHRELLLGQEVQLCREEVPEGWYVCGKLSEEDKKPAFEALATFN